MGKSQHTQNSKLEELSDEELMHRYVGGQKSRQTDAFTQLFHRYAPMIYALAIRQGLAPMQAEEARQRTFLNLHRARTDFDPTAKLRPWLLTIARNVRFEILRSNKRRHNEIPASDGLLECAQSPQGGSQNQDNALLVQQALALLPQGQKEVLELHYFASLSFAEVASVMGLKTNAVKVRAHRAYRQLRLILAEQAPASPKKDPQTHTPKAKQKKACA